MTAEKTPFGSASGAVDRIPLSLLVAYGTGGIIPIALFNIAGILVGLMGNISLGLSAFWLGVILIVPRLWDALSDPVIGHLSDNTRTRWGRRRPYLLVGGILVAVFFVIMWWVPKGDTVRRWFPDESSYHWFQLGYILVTLTLFFTAVTIFEIPHGALGAELTKDSHQRTRLFGAKSFVGNLFAMSTPWLFVLANLERFKGPRGNEADGMRYVSLLVAAIIVPLSFWWFFTLREPGFKKAAQQKATPFWQDMRRTVGNRNFISLTLTIFTLAMGFNFVQLLGSYIPIFYVFGGDKTAGARLLGINGTVWAVTGLLAVFPLDWISPRLGKRNTLILAISLIAVAQLAKVVCYNPAYPYLIVIPTILLSCGMLFFFTLGSSMVGDICDEDELKTGYRAEGSYYSVFWWFIKLGTALASLISGALIVLTMFDETQVTKVDKLQGDLRELRSQLSSEQTPAALSGSDISAPAGSTLVADALAEAGEGLAYLQTRAAELAAKDAHQPERQRAVAQSLTVLRSIAAELEELSHRLTTLGPTTAQPAASALTRQVAQLRLRTKLELAKLDSSGLQDYLTSQARTAANSSEHYRALAEVASAIRAELSVISAAPRRDGLAALDDKLAAVEAKLVKLTRQPPYTLLMMRVVEIGLPLLACCFSLLFVLRYALTETRNRQIKELLAQRHSDDDAGAAPISA